MTLDLPNEGVGVITALLSAGGAVSDKHAGWRFESGRRPRRRICRGEDQETPPVRRDKCVVGHFPTC
jgi:hypothetical protein